MQISVKSGNTRINITKYRTDTYSHLLNKIANHLHTIKEFLIVKEPHDKNEEEIEVVDISENIENKDSWTEVIKSIPDYISTEIKILLFKYFSHLKQLSNSYSIGEYHRIYMELTGDKTQQTEDNSVEWYANVNREIITLLDTRETQINKIERLSYIINALVVEKEFTNFIDNKSITTFEPIDKNIIVKDIFNDCIPSSNIPFVSYNNIYKINNNFSDKIDAKWKSLDNEIVFKILKKYNKHIKKNVYMNAFIRENPTRLDIELDNANQDYINMLLEMQTGDIKLKSLFDIEKPTTSRYISTFYILNQTYNSKIIANMIMNDEFFSYFLGADESTIVNRRKKRIFLFFKKTGPINTRVTVSIKKILVDSAFTRLFRKGQDLIDQNAVGIKINAPSRFISEYCSFVLNKLFCQYNLKYKDHIAVYKEYIPSFKVSQKQSIQHPKNYKYKLKDIDQDIFVAGYKCNNKPVIVPFDENTNANIKNGTVIKFPIKNVTINGLDKNPNYYTCPDTNNKYPALQINKLKNKDVYPLLPCCFEDNQMNKKSSHTYKYYTTENYIPKAPSSKQQNILVTSKAVNFGHMAYIKNIKLFELVSGKNEIYLRQGVCEDIEESDPNSFIKCMLHATNRHETPLLVRKTIASSAKYLSICKQELYNSTDSEIIKILLNEKKYLRPHDFCSVMEQYFDCNIFIFSNVKTLVIPNKNKKSISDNIKIPELVIPNNTHGFLKYKRDKYVFIFENNGSYSNFFDFPICEIIHSHSPLKKINNYIFESKSTIGTAIDELFDSMRSFYSNNLNITSPPSGKFNPELVEYQLIDSYGKTRGVIVSHKNIKIPIYTNPMPILYAPSIKLKEFESYGIISKSTLVEFLAVHGASLLKETSTHYKILLFGIKSKIKKKENTKDISYIDMYKENKKNSNNVKQILYWNVSNAYNFSNTTSQPFDLNKFVDGFIKINKSAIYTQTQTFSIINHLDVKTEETKKRLSYLIGHEFLHNTKLIKNYYINKTPLSPLELVDMKKGSEFTIIDDFMTLLNWNGSYKYNAPKLTRVISPSMKLPCFFINNLISQFPMYTGAYTNILSNLVDSTSPFLLYSYKNKNNIKLYQINSGNIYKNTPMILSFKFNNSLFFLPLFPLS